MRFHIRHHLKTLAFSLAKKVLDVPCFYYLPGYCHNYAPLITACFTNEKTRFVFLSKLAGIRLWSPPKQKSLLYGVEEFTHHIFYLFIISTIAYLNLSIKRKTVLNAPEFLYGKSFFKLLANSNPISKPTCTIQKNLIDALSFHLTGFLQLLLEIILSSQTPLLCYKLLYGLHFLIFHRFWYNIPVGSNTAVH